MKFGAKIGESITRLYCRPKGDFFETAYSSEHEEICDQDFTWQ